GVGVGDGLIEIWQANAAGKYAHPEDKQNKPLERGWRGFGRIPTDVKGGFEFNTIKPGRVPGPDGKLQAPHLVVAVFMRGLLKHLATRIYFPDEPANTEDPILKLVPAARRATLVARRAGKNALEWNVILQGKNETVFFDF
ncbi:MAG TPA: protocatechuate 3,4-dioxygenase subunit alpha, partial [Burkholderiales bacterium]|nr:protocatechuate 3,4-dioxygenase subunit alpha [Burkholderiales bacterium]